LQEAEQPNQIWAIDFKGWCRTGDGARCEPLTITDQASRYLLCCQGLNSTRTEVVRPVMEGVFERYGVPARMRSERIQAGRPQQNGRHERMHRTLKEATMDPPAATFRQQQRRFDEFREEYNQARPHEALGQRVPASLYVPAAVSYTGKILEPDYPAHWPVRKVSDGGHMRWMSQRIFISHALTGKHLGWEPVAEGVWKIWFYKHWLGNWERPTSGCGDRRRCCGAQFAKQARLKAHQQDEALIPPEPPVEAGPDRTTVLGRKGSLRRAIARPCALRAVVPRPLCDGRLRRDELGALLYTKGNLTKRVTHVVTSFCYPCPDMHKSRLRAKLPAPPIQ
jgi:hypothetical protein